MTLSYSNFSTLRTCGQKYKLNVIDKIPQPPAVALEFGTALHAGLNSALVDGDDELAAITFETAWDSRIDKLDFTGERNGPVVLRDMGAKFCARFTNKYAKHMKLVVGEKRMYAKGPQGAACKHEAYKTIELEGTPDALVEWDGENVLLDFKSSAYNYLDCKIDISLQLNLYAWLLEENGYKVDSLAYVVFVKGTGTIQTIKKVKYEREKALQMISEMVSYWSRNEDHFEKNPNGCLMGKSVCPYFDKCWKEEK